jgi:hypothetical protein
MRRHRAVAVGAAALSVVLYAAIALLALVTPLAENEVPIMLLWPAPFLAMAIVGAVVAVRRPENLTGWLLIGSGLLMVLNASANAYAQYSVAGRPLPGTDLMAWLAFWTWMPASGFVALVLMTFPTGHSLSRRWRWVTRASVAVVAVVPIAALFTFPARGPAMLDADSPASVPGGVLLAPLATGVLPLLLPIGFVALVVRFVRSRGTERLQMKWFVFGTSILALAGIVPFLLRTEDPMGHPVGLGSVFVGMSAIPVTAGIAILRYRLYDIDRIISRTFSYAIVSAILGGTFALIVLLPPVLLGGDSAPDYVIAVATLVVAALFRPLRRRVQDAVDHRFNRRRYDAEHTIEAFTTRLRAQTDIDELEVELRDLVAGTMHPSHVSLWIRPPSSARGS